MLRKLQSNPIVTICIIVLIMLCINIEVLSVSIMEARNFITAREMLSDGNWLLTTMNGEARYEKPPLPTWLTAIFAFVFGIKNLIAIRLPAIIMVALTGIFTYLLSNKLLENKQHSFINALIVISSFYVIGIIIEAPWDIFTHGFMLISIYYLFQFFENYRSSYRLAFLAGFFIGCSILSKGPISFYALLLPFLIAYGIIYRFKNISSKLIPILLCLIIALSVGGWWYLFVRLNDPETFTAIAERETNNWSNYNVKPFYYYWSFFTQSGLWTIPAFISLLYPYLKTRVSHLKAYKMSLLWTLITLFLLSIIPEKKSRYLMPILIPLAINIGFYIEYLIRHFKSIKDKRELFPVYFNFGLVALIAFAIPALIYQVFDVNLEIHWFRFTITSIVCTAFGIGIIYQLRKKQMLNVFLLTVFFFVSLFITVLPYSSLITSSNYNSISNLKEQNNKEKINLYGFNYISPEMIWQFGDKIPALKQKDATIQFPNEKQFGMLANGIKPKDEAILRTLYNIEKRETYDLNTVSPDSKRYNKRLKTHFYILTKK